MLKTKCFIVPLMILSVACGRSKNPQISEIPSREFSTASSSYPSFSSVSLEKRCDGILDVLTTMQDSAGERIAISDLSCQNEPNFNFYKNESTRMYEVRFNLSEGSEKKLIHLELDNEVEPELSYTEGDQRVYVGTLPVATSMQAAIGGIEKALRAWYHKDSELPKKVFEIAFEDFAQKAIEPSACPA